MNCPPPNQFLFCLFNKSSAYLQQCDPLSTVILAPVSSSLSSIDSETGLVLGDNLTEDFIQSHILAVKLSKDEVLERARARVYSSINGKTMVIKEDVVFPHRGFKGVREVRVLHDALFWLDDPNTSPYLVYFLDRPLMGTLANPRTRVKEVPDRIHSWSDLLAKYKSIRPSMEPALHKLFDEFHDAVQNEPLGDDPDDRPYEVSTRSRAPSIHSITPVLDRVRSETSFSSSPTLQFVRQRLDLVLSGAIRAFQSLPQTLLHTIGIESSLTGPEIEKLIEFHVLDQLYDLLFYKMTCVTKEKDEEIAQAIEQSKWVDLTQLGTASTLDLRRRHSLALGTFRGFGEHHMPKAKLDSLLATINTLMRNSEKSSDDLIPSLVSVVLASGVSNLSANLLWIREFSFQDVDGGESGFALSTLEAVMYHITSSVNSLSAVSDLNEAFFKALQSPESDQIIKNMVEKKPELLEVRNINDQTPLCVCSPTIMPFLLSKSCSPSSLSKALLTTSSMDVLDRILTLDSYDARTLLNERDPSGQSFAHKIHEFPKLLNKVSPFLDWQLKDNQGNSSLQVLARIYDHPQYEELLESVFQVVCREQQVIHLGDHIDIKGNTLAHVVSTVTSMKTVLKYCIGNFNALNDKGLCPLLISIKFARSAILELLLASPEIDPMTRDFRGHSAIHYSARASVAIFDICVNAELDINDRAIGSGATPLHIASREGIIPILKRLISLDVEEAWDWRGFRAGDIVKNDLVRSLMDEWSCRDREVRVLRGHVGEDCNVKFLIKAKSGGGVLRSVPEFSKLRQWMINRYPALGIASLHLGVPGPCLLHSRPSRAVLLALTERLDAFIQSLLNHEFVCQSPILWEFLLSPTINEGTVEDRIQTEIKSHQQRIWRDEKALSSYDSTRMFFQHAREQIVQLSSTYRVFERKARIHKDAQLNLSVSYGQVGKTLSRIDGVDAKYIKAIEEISDAFVPKEPSQFYRLIEDVVSLDCKISGLLNSLMIPDHLIERIDEYTSEIERHDRELGRTPKFQLSLMADSQARKKAMIKNELQALHVDLKHAGSELRHNEGVLAGELSTFYTVHEERAREVIQRFAGKQIVAERARLAGMERAMRQLQGEDDDDN